MRTDDKREYRETAYTNPDPTVRTVEQLQREVSALKELHGVRLEAMDKAIQVAHDDLVRVPTDVDKAVSSLRGVLQETFKIHGEKFQSTDDLAKEKFAGIQKQFDERDVRTEQSATATKIAVDAALQAQKEAAGAQNESNAAAIAKSEAATTKQIDGIIALLNGGLKALDEKISDLKGRLDRGEGKTTGHGEIWGWIVAAAVVIGVVINIGFKVTTGH